MDKILIQGLQVSSLIGVYDWERTSQTALLVDIEIDVDLAPAGDSDDVADTLDYAKVAELLQLTAKQSTFQLLEALAAAMIAALFAQFNCHKIQLTLSKPNILADASNVAIQLTRTAS
ncbi:dihydroneopterin aldolase [Alteromonadaceae bacterium BrNp21-10]|nr:dihydroneopterin aldolase [Alteromonadaceae bacterium BrNp21-10]